MHMRSDRFRLRRAPIAAIVGLILGSLIAVGPATTTAANVAVTIQDFAFAPTTLTVPVGTTVAWTNRQAGVSHTTTSDEGVWDSGILATGGSFSFRFDRSGTFTYHCNVHPEMHGTVVVTNAAPDAATSTPTQATGAMTDMFADPAFQQLWAKTDAATQGHSYAWGPMPFTAGVKEEYKEAPGGARLVQYFDKGRMELTMPGGAVTAGLLTTELITGKQQIGDATFVQRAPARVPVAGDIDNAFPTYADLAQLQVSEQDGTAGAAPIAKQWNADGTFGSYGVALGDPATVAAGYDETTRHNVPRVFVDFRRDPAFGGTGAIGLAITEPAWVNVRVGGTTTWVLIQAFERRVLTYTPSNPDGLRAEYGNIGRAYYAWRAEMQAARAPLRPAGPTMASPVIVPAAMPPVGPGYPGGHRYP